MPDHDETRDPAPEPESSREPAESRTRFEAARVSRRDALRKMGLTAGFSTALLFSNDFLRIVLGRLAGRRTDEAFADTLSESVRKAGEMVAPREEFLAVRPGAVVRATSSGSRKPGFALATSAKSSKKPALA